MVRNISVALALAGAASPLAATSFSVRGQLQQQVSAGQHSASFQIRLRPSPAAMPMTDY